MKPEDIRDKLGTAVLTHEMLAYSLSGSLTNINDKISRMVKEGELIRLKRGIYVMGERYRPFSIDKIAVANLLYTPSYVSFEYALSYYGLIPERVLEVTSASIRGKKMFDTPIGRFGYRPVPAKAFSLGVDWLYEEKTGGRLIAVPEKALCDKVRSDRGIGAMSQRTLSDYLEHDLRIEWADLLNLDVELIRNIAITYNSRVLRELGALIAKRKKHG